MGLIAPKLDDRKFQDLVDEAKKRIPHYTREWTDHNVSDPGVTLIELFAWMTELTLFRLNQVPDLHVIRFLEILGIKLREPAPASVAVSFWLSAPQPSPLVIPAGTEVASTQTETQRSIIVTTEKDFTIQPPVWETSFSRLTGEGGQKRGREHNMRRLQTGFEGSEIFSSTPQVDDALYFGFENDLSHHILGLDAVFDPAGGAGVDPTQPPYVWEVISGTEEDRWAPAEIEQDTTKGMNSPGRILLHLPAMRRSKQGDKSLYWLRVRVKEISPSERADGMRPYDRSPRLRQLSIASWGAAIQTVHAQRVAREFLGQSDGSPGQRFTLQKRPLLPRQPGETLLVQTDGSPAEFWTEVHDFADSSAYDKHFTLDSISGELRLGPAIRQPDGTIKLYGAVPARGANLTMQSYRHGGGQEGNVQAFVLNTLKTAIPFVSRVANRVAAWGGLDAESLEAAMQRAPAILRSRERAVTEADFEYLATQALPAAIGRVKCLQPRPAEAGRIAPGSVFVLVIPRLPQPGGFLTPDQLNPNEADLAVLRSYLDERRLLTTRLDIRAPAYQWVAARIRLRPSPDFSPDQVHAAVMARLNRFLNPLTGGPAGKGWPFGRDLFNSDVYQCLQGMPEIQFIRSLELFQARPGGESQGNPVEFIEVVSHGVIASGVHTIELI